MMRPPGSTPQPAPPAAPLAPTNGWGAGPDGHAFGGFQTPSGYSGPLSPMTPGGSGRGILYTLLAVCAVAVVGIVVSVVLLTTGGDDAQAADGSGGTTVTDPATDPATDPTDDPTDDPTASVPAPVEPSTSAVPDPEPSDPPSTTEPDPPVEAGSPFSYTEYGDNWNFRIGDVALQASFQQGWDYDTCKPVERNGKLTDLGCVRASEWTLRALRNKVAMTHIVLTFDSPAAAKKAIKQQLIGPDTFTVEPDGLLDDPKRSGGTYVADYVSGAPYVVMTVETHNPRITQDKADEFTHYGTADIQGALGFRDAFG